MTDLMKWLQVTYGLTYRQAEVTDLLAKGVTNRDAADRLFVCEKTIKFHVMHIYRKMGINSRTKLILKCAQRQP